MNIDKHDQDTDLSPIPGEFKQNCRFLSELITCKEMNDSVKGTLETVFEESLSLARGDLNQRQVAILNDFLQGLDAEDPENMDPPVPAELEASIRVRTRSSWLPWEAEAIHKIERWRSDVSVIANHLTSVFPIIPALKRIDPASDGTG